MASPVFVIVNCSAGAGHSAELAASLGAKFRAGGLEPEVVLAQGGSDMIDSVRRAIAGGARLVVAGGGDGTISTVASELAGTDISLGVLPLGTLNHFSKDLRIPADLDQAVQTIVDGHCAKVDVGDVNGRIFVNNSSIGLYPDIVVRRESHQKTRGIGKWRAFTEAMFEVLRRYPFLHARLIVDGKPQDHLTPCVVIGNNEYAMNGFEIGSRSCMDAGMLSVYIVESRNRSALAGVILRALLGRLRPTAEFKTVMASEVVVETRQSKNKRVATDGEVTMMDSPLHYRIRPRALNVIVPKPDAPPAKEG